MTDPTNHPGDNGLAAAVEELRGELQSLRREVAGLRGRLAGHESPSGGFARIFLAAHDGAGNNWTECRAVPGTNNTFTFLPVAGGTNAARLSSTNAADALLSADSMVGASPVLLSAVIQQRVTATAVRHVRLPMGVFAVGLSNSGGGNASSGTSRASYTYDVYAKTYNPDATPAASGAAPIATNRAMVCPRPPGEFSPATDGLATVAADGSVVLLVAFEEPATTTECEAP